MLTMNSIDNPKRLRLSALRQASQRKLPDKIEKGDWRLEVCAHLIDEELLEGWVTLSEDGDPLNVLDPYITPRGKDVLHRYEEKVASKRPHTIRPVFPASPLLKAAAAFLVLITFLLFVGKSTENTAQAGPENISVTVEGSHRSTRTLNVCGVAPAE